jgi:hypothetical protein
VLTNPVVIPSRSGCEMGATPRNSLAERRKPGNAATGVRSCACVGFQMAGHCQKLEMLVSMDRATPRILLV